MNKVPEVTLYFLKDQDPLHDGSGAFADYLNETLGFGLDNTSRPRLGFSSGPGTPASTGSRWC